MTTPRQTAAWIGAALAVALGAAWWLRTPSAAGAGSAPGIAADDTGRGVDASAPAPTDSARDDPRVRSYEQRQAFEADARRFFADAKTLRPVARSERARTLAAEVDRYEAERGLSAGEALVLRVGLIEATVDDPAERSARVAALSARYREVARQREAAYEAAHDRDPHFRDYKAREAAIVDEVMALPTIPGGLSRDEYLRQRLQDARVAAYR
jgi:hypothetical protein